MLVTTVDTYMYCTVSSVLYSVYRSPLVSSSVMYNILYLIDLASWSNHSSVVRGRCRCGLCRYWAAGLRMRDRLILHDMLLHYNMRYAVRGREYRILRQVNGISKCKSAPEPIYIPSAGLQPIAFT